MQPDVLVIGGGLSGLCAAVDLANHRYSVFLSEEKPHLGGRTYSFIDERTGDQIDNGQHLMMGCYTQTLQYIRTIGSYSSIRIQDTLRIPFRHAVRGDFLLKAPRLPQPLNILFGLMLLKSISVRDRLALIKVGIKLISTDPDQDETLIQSTVSQWLESLGQSEEAMKYLWNVIAIGTLNDDPERVSAALFAKVLRSAFFGPRMNSSMVIPTSGLSSVLVDPAESFLTERGGSVKSNCGIRRIILKRVAGKLVADAAELENGEVIRPKAMICAVPFFDIKKIFGEEDIREIPELQSAERFSASPIVSIHLWFDREIISEDFVALIDSPIHWIFNKSKMYGKKAVTGQYLSLVISGASDMIGKSKKDIEEMSIAELRKFYPASAGASVIHTLVIKEKRATFSPHVGIETYRPANQTHVDNLFLAGDWTDTKLPATIEGAVRSGNACSTLVQALLKG
jgi:squalene-associated FAD-dependent desaturase